MDNILLQIHDNCRDWHHWNQNERPPEVGELLRAFLIEANVLASQTYPMEYARKVDAQILQTIHDTCDSGFDAPGHAGVQMVYARTLVFFAREFRVVALMLASAHQPLISALHQSEAFYQAQPDPL
jgi:hypothetical protein